MFIFQAHQHKASGRKTRLDIENCGCNGSLLCDHDVVLLLPFKSALCDNRYDDDILTTDLLFLSQFSPHSVLYTNSDKQAQLRNTSSSPREGSQRAQLVSRDRAALLRRNYNNVCRAPYRADVSCCGLKKRFVTSG